MHAQGSKSKKKCFLCFNDFSFYCIYYFLCESYLQHGIFCMLNGQSIEYYNNLKTSNDYSETWHQNQNPSMRTCLWTLSRKCLHESEHVAPMLVPRKLCIFHCKITIQRRIWKQGRRSVLVKLWGPVQSWEW